MHRNIATTLVTATLAVPTLVAPSPAAASTLPGARYFAGQANVGPLFRSGVAGSHACVGTVISSSTHDLVVTAAHCVSGHGTNLTFAPGYADGRTPHGVWRVSAAYVDDSWELHRDPRHDLALLVMAPRAGRRIQDVTGASGMGLAQPRGTATTVPAYRSGRNDWPIRCTNRISYTAGYPAFACRGYPDGVSGAPFLVDGWVTGVIGGLHQGGCTPSVSYSAPFTTTMINTLYRRATHRLAQRSIPGAGGDGC